MLYIIILFSSNFYRYLLNSWFRCSRLLYIFFNSTIIAITIKNSLNKSNYILTPEVKQIIFGSLLGPLSPPGRGHQTGDGKLDMSNKSKTLDLVLHNLRIKCLIKCI